jgi:hypothetical protein
MTEVQSTPSVCPKCHKAMKLMLVKARRKLACMDCGQTDPMTSDTTSGWLKGELGGPLKNQTE